MNIVQTTIDKLIPYARNSRTHSAEQVAQIAASIREFGFTNPVLIDESDGIIAGHGRVLAARKLGMDKVPSIRLSHLTETQKRAYIIADNRLALNAGWDDEMLAAELQDLMSEEFDIDLLGFDQEELDALFNNDTDEENPYTKKIDAPVYEPVGDKPEIWDLYDDDKAVSLQKEIEGAGLPEEEKLFLLKAAERHTVFDFEQIANYYAHSPPEVQKLMEDSALVIIDFGKAIENGYIRLSERLQETYSQEYPDA